MKYTKMLGYNISGLTLGTVALGLNYNVFDYQQRPNETESHSIIDTAAKMGINTLDTAREYGDAEQIVGKYMAGMQPDQLLTITKFKISREAIRNKDKARVEMMHSVKSSLFRLGMSRIPICLFHMDSSLPLDLVRNIIPGLLEELVNEGLVAHGGISADNPLEVHAYADFPVVEAIQVPLNVFDQRLIKKGTFKWLKGKNKIVFARSVFLKGLIFMRPGDLKGNLRYAGHYLRLLQNLALDADMSISQLAFSYVRDIDGVTSIVFGADKQAHVAENVELMNGKPLSHDLRSAIEVLFEDTPEDLITPRNWSF